MRIYITEIFFQNDNILNADTDVPNDEDNQISLIEDPHTQAEIRWIKYLQRLREGAWGDHLAVQVLASMLNVNIKIISTLNPDMPLVKPLNCTSICNIYLGLIDQFHYVALVKKSSMNAENNKHDILNTEDEDLEEKERAEDEAAFEHEYQIKGALFETTLTPENPELGEKIYSVAPGEGQKPILILTDIKFEEMCNPDKYPFGQGGIHMQRLKEITPRKYFNQRILDVDGRFARDVEYLFAAQYAVEAKQIMDDANNFIFRQHPGRQNSGQPINAGFLKNTEKLQELVHRDYAFKM